MSQPSANASAEHHRTLRLGTIILLLLGYAGLGAYFHIGLRSNLVYSHFAYIPIALAGMWWGRRCIVVAAILAAMLLSFHLFGISSGQFKNDLARIAFYVIAAICIGALSDRVRAGQAALSASERNYRQLIEKSLAGIVVYRDEKIVFANPKFYEILGYRPEDILGEPIWSIIYDDDEPKVRELVLKRDSEGVPDLHYECRLVKADGEPVWADMASSTADYEGRSAVLVNAYDITGRKQAEHKRRELAEVAKRQEEQLVHSTRLAELGEMAAAVAHELNQPLTGIRNFARNAAYMLDNDAGSPKEVRENLRLISEQVDRASRIINQMRELTRRTERRFGSVDVNTIVRESLDFLMPQMKLSGVEVSLQTDDELPEVMGERIRLEQVFLNLLTNARQVLEEATVRRLSVRTYRDGASDLPIVVEIADTGKGFSRDEANRLFTPFYSTKKAGQGTGLGLSISLRIIEDHNGRIEADGETGKGATFRVRFPAACRTGAEDEPADEQA